MRLIKIIIICLVVVLTGCAASGTKYKDMMSSIPPVPADKGRIFFYRMSSVIGAAVQPSIMLDGVKVGDSRRGGFFYVDRAPGIHVVSLTTEVETKRSVNLAEREIKYVKTSVEMGVFVGHMNADVMYPENAKDDLLELSYTGFGTSNTIAGSPAPAPVVPSAVPAAAQQPQSDTVDRAENLHETPSANGAERWTGLMSCDAREGKDARSVAYQAKFAMEVSGNLVTIHRLTAKVAETLTGQITNNMLELKGEGFRLETPDRRWQFKIAGSIQPGAPIYTGAGNMLTKGKAIRACELTMTRLSKPA
jgi:hypothetical protein